MWKTIADAFTNHSSQKIQNQRLIWYTFHSVSFGHFLTKSRKKEQKFTSILLHQMVKVFNYSSKNGKMEKRKALTGC